MSKLTCSLVLLALLGLGMVPSSASAGVIQVYFDAAGDKPYADAGPVGDIVNMWVYGKDFEADAPFTSGAQFRIIYPAHIQWLADVPLYAAFIGTTPTGYSVGFGLNPQFGTSFPIVKVIGTWTGDCAGLGQNVDGPWSDKHPLFPDPTPVVSRFPDQATFPAGTARSQTCQMVELDIMPLHCPNEMSQLVWQYTMAGVAWKAGLMPVVIMGSATVDVNDIDRSTILLEGVAARPWPQTTWYDLAIADGDNDCVCDYMPPPPSDDDDDLTFTDLVNLDRDGYKDLLLFFERSDVALAIGPTPPAAGAEIPLTLTGNYNDGMAFESVDCVTIIEGRRHRRDIDNDSKSSKSSKSKVAGLGFPSPNPFNPVTRISYNVPTTQHVRIAIFDVAGRLVENLVNETKGAGQHVVEWDAGRLPSGVYFYRMQAGDQTIVRRATLIK